MIVAVGSTRGPKVEAVRRVLAELGDRAGELAQAEIVAVDVTAGGTPPMPLSLDELLDGARSRAQLAVEALQTQGRRADMRSAWKGDRPAPLGPSGRRGFLMSWAYVTDGRRGAHGCGGAIEVPRSLLDRVVTDGIELAEAIDAFAREHDVRSRQGAWGVLSGGLFDRTRSFEIALVNALAPFYNEAAYE